MNVERRRALGIPVHEQESEHTFVDGFCTCGKEQREQKDRHGRPAQATKAKYDLDYIENNWNRGVKS